MGTLQANGLFDGVRAAMNGLRNYLPEPVARGVDFASSLARAKDELTLSLSPEYQALLERQIEVQTEVQQATFASNIERSKHETRMAPVRNLRVS